MNDIAPSRTPLRPALVRALAGMMLLALVSLACSVGGILQGGSAGDATPTRTPRPTFTPLPGALTTAATGLPPVRGTLPPGVTVQAPAGAGSNGESPFTVNGTPVSMAGETDLLLFATNTPTVTPTPTQRPATATPIEREGLGGPAAQATAYVVIKPATLNGRRGPGTNYERIGEASKGQELFVLGRTTDGAWLQVCCMANQPVWVAADQVDAKGVITSAPVLTPPPTPLPPPPTRPPQPAQPAVPRVGQSPLATPRPAGTPLPPFDISRGPEFPIKRDNGILTAWIKVHEGTGEYQRPLGGYILKVMRDGVDISDNIQSFDDRPFDITPPNQGAYEYNLKFEKYEAGEADWEIYLARPGGIRMSPVTKFTTKGDSYRNLVVYIAYLLAR